MNVATRQPALDSVGLTVLNNFLVNACREMGLAMMKTAYSSIFNEGLDFSCIILDRDGEMVAYAEFCPAQIGAILYTVKWTIEELGLDSFHPGDVVMHNDPYRGGCHMPEHTVIKPVFFNGELYGFVANIAHITEIGGKAVGGFAADAKEVYQEGLRLPPIKIIDQGRHVEDLWKVILCNHRTPLTSWGDFHAMIGSLSVAERRLEQALAKHGTAGLLAAGKDLMAYSEQRMRAEIRELPNGEYAFEDWIENDGVDPTARYRIHCLVNVRDDNIIFDYTGSSPQAKGPCNCTYGVTASATYNAMLNLTDQTIPRNSGCYRPLRLIVPPGSVLNVAHPGPSVGGNSEIHERIVDVLFGALAGAVPERVAAGAGASSCNFLFGGRDPHTGQYYANYHIEGSGWGATRGGDGNHTQCPINGNCRNTPVEVFETRYPWVVESYRLAPGSGGHGRTRGGYGCIRVLRVEAPEITVSSFMDRHQQGTWGLFGGAGGSPGTLQVMRAGETEWQSFSAAFGTTSSSKFADVQLHRGDRVRIVSPGGGGYGSPLERDPALVLEDVREGFCAEDAAFAVYGVVLQRNEGRLALDIERTENERRRRCDATRG
ncbi:MAG: hydantoinase B/oxoprolinase family protein [Acetobacteraceae bacterium]